MERQGCMFSLYWVVFYSSFFLLFPCSPFACYYTHSQPCSTLSSIVRDDK